MSIDPTISASAISEVERAIIDQYGFDLKDDTGHFVLIDPTCKKAKQRYKFGPGGNLSLLLRAAMDNHDQHKRAQILPKVEPIADAENDTSQKCVASSEAHETSDACVDTSSVSSQIPDAPEPPPYDFTAEQNATIAKYGFVVTSNPLSDNIVIEDPAVTKFYAFKNASKKGRYVGSYLDELLNQAVVIHEEMLAEQAGGGKNGNGNGKKTATKAAGKQKADKPAKPLKVKKDNRYLRAFRVIIADPNITADSVAKKANMSISMANACIAAWQAAVAVMNEKK